MLQERKVVQMVAQSLAANTQRMVAIVAGDRKLTAKDFSKIILLLDEIEDDREHLEDALEKLEAANK